MLNHRWKKNSKWNKLRLCSGSALYGGRIMRLGVDLGGTKIEAMVIDEHGDECWRQRVLTPQGDYDATLNAIAQLVRVGKRTLGVCSSAAIGMGTPGAETKDGRMKNCNSTALNG